MQNKTVYAQPDRCLNLTASNIDVRSSEINERFTSLSKVQAEQTNYKHESESDKQSSKQQLPMRGVRQIKCDRRRRVQNLINAVKCGAGAYERTVKSMRCCRRRLLLVSPLPLVSFSPHLLQPGPRFCAAIL